MQIAVKEKIPYLMSADLFQFALLFEKNYSRTLKLDFYPLFTVYPEIWSNI